MGAAIAPIVPSRPPTTARAGDTWTWTAAFADYPVSEGWVLSYAIRGESAPTWSASWVTDDGNEFTVTIPAATTAAIAAGVYRLVGFVTLAGARYTVYDAALTVNPDSATQAAGDAQTHTERMLAIVEAEIEARVTGVGSAVETYQIGDRMVSKIPLADLYRLRNQYRAELRRLMRPGEFGTPIKARFTQTAATWPVTLHELS